VDVLFVLDHLANDLQLGLCFSANHRYQVIEKVIMKNG
jgi:hypothetical protein